MIGGAGRGSGIVVRRDGEIRVQVGVGQLSVVGELGRDDDMVEDLGVPIFNVGPALVGRERKRQIGERRSDQSADAGLNNLRGR